MTNEEINSIIERQEFALERSAAFAPAFFWFGSFAFALVAFLSLSISWATLVFCVMGSASLFSTFEVIKASKERRSNKARLIWEGLGRNHTFGSQLPLSTRQLGTEIQKIYNGDPSGKLFPLRQAIRLLDTHHLQQERLHVVEERLRESCSLQESLSSKIAQLRELGEDYPQGARNLEQINKDLVALKSVHGQIRGSCTRLEAIVIGVQKATQSRKLHRELDELSAQIPLPMVAVEPAFEAESLEEIEHQIGREIETYLRLERETEEHLR